MDALLANPPFPLSVHLRWNPHFLDIGLDHLKLSDELVLLSGSFCILQALAKTLTTDQLFYLREQFELLGPNKSGYITLQNLKTVS
jgi:hypothetical protein